MEELKKFLKENLKLIIEEKCNGHMAPTKKFIILKLGNDVLSKVELLSFEVDGTIL